MFAAVCFGYTVTDSDSLKAWAWPAYFPKIVRSFLWWLLSDIDRYFHDLGVLLAKDSKDLLEADRGVKKYGFESIDKVTEQREETFNTWLILYDYIIAWPIKFVVVYLVYWILRLWSRFSTNY